MLHFMSFYGIPCHSMLPFHDILYNAIPSMSQAQSELEVFKIALTWLEGGSAPPSSSTAPPAPPGGGSTAPPGAGGTSAPPAAVGGAITRSPELTKRVLGLIRYGLMSAEHMEYIYGHPLLLAEACRDVLQVCFYFFSSGFVLL